MQTILNIIQNRNVILISALITAFIVPAGGNILADYTIYILALVMSFSTTGINFKIFANYKSVIKITLESVFLNYVIYGTIILTLAYFFTDEATFYGFVVIAATPPGVAIIPFTYTFKGDTDYSFKGILGTYILSIIITPVIISLFTENVNFDIEILIIIIIKVIVIPILLSRVLLLKFIYPAVEKIRGKIIDWGFALIIYTAIALNRDLIFSEYKTVIVSSLILFAAIFVSGFLIFQITKKGNKKLSVSRNLMLTIKGSGFAIAVTLILFDQSSAIPAAVMSIFVLLYLITLNLFYNKE